MKASMRPQMVTQTHDLLADCVLAEDIQTIFGEDPFNYLDEKNL